MRTRAPALLLVALSMGCGSSLYTADGLPPLGGNGSQCVDPTPMSCPGPTAPVCVAHDVTHCASCTDACGAPPAGAAAACLESTPGAQDWACGFTCDPGLLKDGAGCSSALALDAGDRHTCAILASGRLRCWGENAAGQVTGTPGGLVTFPRDVFASGVTAVAAGLNHTCAVVSGAVQCWGANGSGQAPPSVPAAAGATALAAGASHTCALLADQTVTCWGTGAAATAPVLSGVTRLVSGANHACALTAAGAVTCWGDNSRSQLAGTGLTGMAFLASGRDHACAGTGLKANLATLLLCWGDNSSGQIPSAGTNPVPSPVTGQAKVNFDYDMLVAGGGHTCVHRTGENVKCFGDNAAGQLGQSIVAGELATVSGPATTPPEYGPLALGGSHSCLVFPDGNLQCFGANASGQLGDGTTSTPALGTYVFPSGR